MKDSYIHLHHFTSRRKASCLEYLIQTKEKKNTIIKPNVIGINNQGRKKTVLNKMQIKKKRKNKQ